MENKESKIIARRNLLETPRFTVYRDIVVDECNQEKEFFYLKKPDAVTIVVHKKKQIAFLKVKRHLIAEISYELPGGRIEQEEQPLEAAKRELQEETGLISNSWDFLSLVFPLPSITTERVHIFSVNIDEDAVIKVAPEALNEGIANFEFIEFDNIGEMVMQNKITCSVDGYAVLVFLQKHYKKSKGELA